MPQEICLPLTFPLLVCIHFLLSVSTSVIACLHLYSYPTLFQLYTFLCIILSLFLFFPDFIVLFPSPSLSLFFFGHPEGELSVVSQCTECSLLPLCSNQLNMTVPMLHPNPSSNEPAIICLTQRDTFRLLSSLTVIQATALLPQMVQSCREQSIDINLKYLFLSHILSYYTECQYACEPAEQLCCRT